MTPEEFHYFAFRYYRRIPDLEQFRQDIRIFRYIVRHLNAYKETGEIQIQVVLNHFVTLFNIFEPRAAVTLLQERLKSPLYPALKPFLIYLNYLDEDHDFLEVSPDLNITRQLQKLG